MFADPLPNVTLGGVAQVMPNTLRDATQGKNPVTRAVYQTADSSLVETIQQRAYREAGYGRRKSTASLVHTKSASDLSNPELQRQYHADITIIIDRPEGVIFTETEIVNLVLAQVGMLTASTNAAIKKLYGNES